MVINVTMGTVLMGYLMGVYNLNIDNLDILYTISDKDKSFYHGLITSVIPFGAMIGAIINAFTNKLSRRLVFIILDILTIIFLGLSAIENLAILIISRLLLGMCVGLNTAFIPTYINEISPIAINGLTGSCFQTMCNVGFLLVFSMGLNVPNKQDFNADNQWWRVMFLFPVITCSIRLFSFLFIYKFDTPYYYVSTKSQQLARTSLSAIYKPDFVEDELSMTELIIKRGSKNVKYTQLFSKKFKKRLALGLALPVIQQLSGINAILFYSSQIFKGNTDNPTKEQQTTS